MKLKQPKFILAASGLLVLSLWVSLSAYQAWGAWNDNIAPVGGDEEEVSAEVNQLNLEIQKRKDSIADLQRQQDSYKQAIAAKQAEKADLANQVAIFDNRLASLQASQEKVKLNMEETELEIKKLDLAIKAKEEAIKREKDQIALALSLLYKEGNKSDLEIILLQDNFVDYIDQIKQLKDLNSGIGDSLDELKKKQKSLEENKQELDEKQLSLKALAEELVRRQEDVQTEKQSKQVVLDLTRQSEAEYQRLLDQAKREQQAAASDISSLEKSVRQKLAKNTKFNNLNSSSEGLAWPVPKNTITAYFHDPDYPFRNVFEHPAIDIRAGQGTTVRAAASGYVARVKDGGASGYSYIMLVHNDGLSTVYGHVSSINVQEEEYVTQGQVIGLSGGMPGTRGAGRLTTGPHLHLEVRLNGIPVNALEYLQ